MPDLDLKKCNSPDAVIVALIHAAGDFSTDGANLESCGQNGQPWYIISQELDIAISKMVRRIIAAGYPLDPSLRELRPRQSRLP